MTKSEAVDNAEKTLDHMLEASNNELDGSMKQFLIFVVENGEYCVDIMRVREIRGWVETTRIPNSPDYMRGVINLRGLVVPIFDLRSRFNQGKTIANDKHVVIILAIGSRTIGILVDAVSDILHVSERDVKPAPTAGEAEISDEYVSGLISVGEKMVVLLDIDYLFDASALEQADEII